MKVKKLIGICCVSQLIFGSGIISLVEATNETSIKAEEPSSESHLVEANKEEEMKPNNTIEPEEPKIEEETKEQETSETKSEETAESKEPKVEEAKEENTSSEKEPQLNPVVEETEMTTKTIQEGDWGTSPWLFDETTGILTLESGTLGIDNESPWNTTQIDVKLIKEIKIADGVKAPINSRALFSSELPDKQLINLEKITGYLNVDEVRDMVGMFVGASNLSEVDVSNWNTGNVNVMDAMFYKARSLSSLDVSKWDTSNVTNMEFMFSDSNSLSTLDVSKWDTSNVTNMEYMFKGSNSLSSLEVSNWDTSKVTNMEYMFKGSNSLSSLDVSKWDTSNVTNMQYMFHTTSNLSSLEVSKWDTSNVTNMEYMFSDSNSLSSLEVSKWDTSNVTNMQSMFRNASNLSTLDVSKWVTSKVTNMQYMFYSASNLSSLDVSKWDTSNVTNMQYTFDAASSLSSLDVSKWDTSNVTNMKAMFGVVSSLSTLDVSKWDTSNVTNMEYMFSDSNSLSTLDVSKWDTSNVTNMDHMFYTTSNLSSLEVSKWDTSNVTNMQHMFHKASNLSTLDVSNWNTEKVTSMVSMFSGTKLERLTLGTNFHFTSDAGLQKPIDSTSGTTRDRWMKEDGTSKAYSPSEMMGKYGTDDLTSGTYIAEYLNANLIGDITFNLASEKAQIGDKLTSLITVRHDKKDSASSVAKNIKFKLTDFITQAFEMPKSASIALYDENDDIVDSTVATIKANVIEIPDLPKDQYAVITIQGTLWNNTTLSNENYITEIDYTDDNDSNGTFLLNGYFGVTSGSLSFNEVPKVLTFEETKLTGNLQNKLVDRKEKDWAIKVNDYRGTNAHSSTEAAPRQNWEITALAQTFKDTTNKEIPYNTLSVAYIVDGKTLELNNSDEVSIVSHDVKDESPKEHNLLMSTWKAEEGLKAIVHNRNGLDVNKEYKASVDFELRQAP